MPDSLVPLADLPYLFLVLSEGTRIAKSLLKARRGASSHDGYLQAVIVPVATVLNSRVLSIHTRRKKAFALEGNKCQENRMTVALAGPYRNCTLRLVRADGRP